MAESMTGTLNPAAPHHLPAFITAPGETDVLMVVAATVLAISVVGFGLVFLRLHTLPERMAHKSKKIQFEIVAVLGLLALFTHIHAFWVAGLLLALVDFPDFGSFMGRIAGSVEKIAGVPPPPETDMSSAEIGGMRDHAHGDVPAGKGEAAAATLAAKKPESVPARKKEASHA
jgi:hypothetical protein